MPFRLFKHLKEEQHSEKTDLVVAIDVDNVIMKLGGL